jgi:hypothetical protein
MITGPALTREELSYRRLFHQASGEISNYPQDAYSGHGIVVCGGGERCFTNAWIHLHILREELQCTLPIEYWYFGEEELDDTMRALLEPLQVSCVDGTRFAHDLPEGEGRGYALKAVSIWKSSFREVLFLDADNVPLRDPAFLFLDESYLRTGALFWPDIRHTDKTSRIWKVLNLPYRPDLEFESGQLVINKELWWQPLALAMHLNAHFPFYYRHIPGDKQTFQLAAWKLDHPYAYVGRAPELIEANIYQSMLNQFAPDGSLLFQHRTQADWNLFGENPVIPGYRFEKEARALLAKLGSCWSGAVHRNEPADLTAPKLATFRGIKEPVWIEHTARGWGRKLMELRPDGSVGRGAGWDGRTWRCDEQDGIPVLTLSAGRLDLVHLRADPSGVWKGRVNYTGAAEIEVISVKDPVREKAHAPPQKQRSAPWLGLFYREKASPPSAELGARELAREMETPRREFGTCYPFDRIDKIAKWESIFWKYPQVANEVWCRLCVENFCRSSSTRVRQILLRCLVVLTAQRPELVVQAVPWERQFWLDLIDDKSLGRREEEILLRWFCTLSGLPENGKFQKILGEMILARKDSVILQKTLLYLLTWDEPLFAPDFYPAFRRMAQHHPDWRSQFRYLLMLRPGPMTADFCSEEEHEDKYLIELESRKRGAKSDATGFSIREAMGERFRTCDRAGARLIVVHNVQDGQGDEILRMSNLLHAFLHRFPQLDIHLFGKRRYLYDHSRVIFHELAARDDLKEMFRETPVGLINFYEPWVDAGCSDPDFEKELRQCNQNCPAPFEITAAKGYNYFLYQSFKIGGKERIAELELNHRLAPNVYDASWRLLLEMGLPIPTWPAMEPKPSAYTGKPHAAWAADWESLTAPLRRSGAKRLALINPFGGQNLWKGFLPDTFGYLLKDLQHFVQQGYGLVLVTNGTSWGKAETLEQLRPLLPKECQERIVIDPETFSLPADAGLNMADAAMQRRKYFAHYADLIVTVEGWLTHLAHALGKPYRMWLAPGSYPSDWRPPALPDEPTLLKFRPETAQARVFGNHTRLVGLTAPFSPEKSRLLRALEALGESGDAERREVYLHYSFSPDQHLRCAALRGLAPFRDRKTQARLREALNDPGAKVRAAAAMALAGRTSLSDDPREIRSKKLRAYVHIGAYDWVRLRPLGRAAESALKATLNDTDLHMRRDAALILREITGKKK